MELCSSLPECETLVLLDVEFTAWEGSQERNWSEPWEEKEIIQIAMLALNRETLAPDNHYSCMVKPTINPKLSDYVSKLTGITQSGLDSEGLSLQDAFDKSVEFLNSFPAPVIVISNGVDGYLLNENAKMVGLECPGCLAGSKNINPYIATKTPGYRKGHCTSDLANLVGHPLEGHKHNALYDVHSMAIALRYIEFG